MTSPLNSIFLSDVVSPVITNTNIKNKAVRAIHIHRNGPKGLNNVR